MALNDDMSAVFKSSRNNLDAVPDNTVGVDPESGNEIPLGSLPEEVRDDIPAQLSEGEYVVPADVVRYYGVKFFEDLRADAKYGYQDMEQNGRIGGEPPMGMEMIEPEDDMMFDISELEFTEVADEPEAAFLGKLFGGKKEEKSPEDSVRERFEKAAKRDNSKEAIAKRVALRKKAHDIAKAMAEKEDRKGGARLGSGFSGSPQEPAERKYGGGSQPAQTSGAGSVYNPSINEPTFAEYINFGGDYAEGGAVEDMGRLGLGAEGIGLSSGSSGVMEVREYRNDAGHTLMIIFVDGKPITEIPDGYYPVGDAPEAVVTPEEVAQPTGGGDDGGPDFPVAEAVDYKNLTKLELAQMLEEQQSTKGEVIAAGLGAVNPIMGLFIKGAMWDQSRRLENEIARRAGLDGISEADKTDYTLMLEAAQKDKPSLVERIFGKLTGKTEEAEPTSPETYSPEAVVVDPQSVNDAVAEAMAYDPTAKTVLEDSDITATELPDVSVYRAAGEEAGAAARKRVLEGKAVSTPPKMINEEYDSDQGRLSTQNQIFEARSRAREGTQDVLKTMRDRGAGRTERTAAVKEGARIENVMADQARGIQRGFKKGGLASKKKK